jgi:hypothetical protein
MLDSTLDSRLGFAYATTMKLNVVCLVWISTGRGYL